MGSYSKVKVRRRSKKSKAMRKAALIKRKLDLSIAASQSASNPILDSSSTSLNSSTTTDCNQNEASTSSIRDNSSLHIIVESTLNASNGSSVNSGEYAVPNASFESTVTVNASDTEEPIACETVNSEFDSIANCFSISEDLESYRLIVEPNPTPEPVFNLDGRRIVDIQHVLRWSMRLQDDHRKICTLGRLILTGEKRKGLQSTFVFTCKSCRR